MTRYRCLICGRDQYTTRTDAEKEPCIHCGKTALEKMIGLDENSCVSCGREIPEGRQVCPECESKYCADPTDTSIQGKFNIVIKAIEFIANEAEFEIINHIELRDKKSGLVIKSPHFQKE